MLRLEHIGWLGTHGRLFQMRVAKAAHAVGHIVVRQRLHVGPTFEQARSRVLDGRLSRTKPSPSVSRRGRRVRDDPAGSGRHPFERRHFLCYQREQRGAAKASHFRIGDSARRSDDQREGRQVRPSAPERRSAGVAVGGVAEDHLAPGRLQLPDRQARGSVPGARRGVHGAAPGDRAAPRQGPDGAVAF